MASALSLLLAAFFCVFASAEAQTNVTDNPADRLVAAINANRTAHKSSSLYDNAGLACIALQYIKAYEGDCSSVGGENAKKPADTEFAESFAPKCGVMASSLSPITGRFIGCQTKYIHAPEAFSMLVDNSKALDILYDKNHTEVGAAVTGTNNGSPYFWCVLFSNGKTNSSFLFEDGVAKVSKPGCFSGANDVCSRANGLFRPGHLWLLAATAFLAAVCAFGL